MWFPTPYVDKLLDKVEHSTSVKREKKRQEREWRKRALLELQKPKLPKSTFEKAHELADKIDTQITEDQKGEAENIEPIDIVENNRVINFVNTMTSKFNTF